VRKANLRAETPTEKAEAERIRQILIYAREQLGLTQQDVANHFGWTQSRYWRIEHDFKYVNSYVQEMICDYLYLPKPVIFKE
jgi:transcriptional regulator with XRE-family HTH domain